MVYTVAVPSSLGDALGLVCYLYSPSRVSPLGVEIPVVRTRLGDELAGIRIVLVPRFLRRVERTCVGVALGLEVEDGVDSVRCFAIADSDHDRILVRTHDVGNAV